MAQSTARKADKAYKVDTTPPAQSVDTTPPALSAALPRKADKAPKVGTTRPAQSAQSDALPRKSAKVDTKTVINDDTCLEQFRRVAEDYIHEDLKDWYTGTPIITPNPYTQLGSKSLYDFCDALHEFKVKTNDYQDAPAPVVMLGYHGTSSDVADAILKSMVMPGYMNLYGPGAYFATDIPTATMFAVSKNRNRGININPNDQFVDIIVCAIILDEEKLQYIDAATTRKKNDNYLVNSDIDGHIPLFHLKVQLMTRDKLRDDVGTVPFLMANTVYRGNASTLRRNVGGKRKNTRGKRIRTRTKYIKRSHPILFMTLDGNLHTT